MKLIVSEQAQRQIRQTAQYLQWRNGTGSMRKFIAALHRVQLLQRKNPKLGPAEPMLADLQRSYRSMVVTPYNKIIYCIVDDVIEIADFWDTRLDPSSLVHEVS